MKVKIHSELLCCARDLYDVTLDVFLIPLVLLLRQKDVRKWKKGENDDKDRSSFPLFLLCRALERLLVIDRLPSHAPSSKECRRRENHSLPFPPFSSLFLLPSPLDLVSTLSLPLDSRPSHLNPLHALQRPSTLSTVRSSFPPHPTRSILEEE